MHLADVSRRLDHAARNSYARSQEHPMRQIMLALAAALLLAACIQGGQDQEQGTAPAEAAPNDATSASPRTCSPTTSRPSRWPSWSTAAPTGPNCTNSATAS